MYVSCSVCIPFVELLSDKFRPVLYYRILFLTEVLIGFLAVQLEVLDAVMSLDEFSDYTIFIAAVITWYELYAAYLKPQPIELGIHVFLGGALYAQGPLLEAFILMAVACLFIVGSLRASRARVIATYFLICASSTLTPKVSRFGLVLTMLKTLFAPVGVMCLYHATTNFFSEGFVMNAKWPVAALCTLVSLAARLVVNFAMLASLSSSSV